MAALVCAVYAGSLSSGFLNYDDDWLIERNAVLADADPATLATIFGDLSRETRLVLGAEYLPVRDVVVWLELAAFGLNAPAMRTVSLLLYVAAVLAFRRWLHVFVPRVHSGEGSFAMAELAAWLFALHPVHVESVAWLAGQKDVLCLLLTGLALSAYSSERQWVRWLAAPACAVASLSKGQAVVLPGLLVLTDLFSRRRVDWLVIGASAAFAASVAGLQTSVGATVGLFAPMHGGSRLATFAIMGIVAWRYLALSFGFAQPNIIEEVQRPDVGDPLAWIAWAGIGVLGCACALSYRRGWRLPAFGGVWLVLALAPVSQIVFPLQNLIADRYLFVAVLGPCVTVAWALASVRPRAPIVAAAAAIAMVLAASSATAYRAIVFADSTLLWLDATARTQHSTSAPYQLAMALEAAGDVEHAEGAFREAVSRDGFRTEGGRRAVNNLGRLLARRGRIDEGIRLYRDAISAWPDDPKLAANLAELLSERGDHDEAIAIFRDVMRRFPQYERARRRYQTRYGSGRR